MVKNLKVINMNKCIGCFSCMIACAGVNKHSHALNKSAIKIRTSGGMTGRFVADVCVACEKDAPCALSCPADALLPRKGGGVLVDYEKCIGCGKCVDACMVGAVHFDKEKNHPIICRHCGACPKFCPHGCISMEEVEVTNDL
jgi:carbon-monoxide dehydrogenase iron sulfur subunit